MAFFQSIETDFASMEELQHKTHNLRGGNLSSEQTIWKSYYLTSLGIGNKEREANAEQ
jgi:hypothetical protein